MYIVGLRFRTKVGKSTEGAEHTLRTRDLIVDATGENAWAWSIALGEPTGSYMVSSRAEDLEHALQNVGKVKSHIGFHALSERGSHLLDAPSEMTMHQVIGTAGERAAPTKFISITQASIANGHAVKALDWSADMLRFTAEVTGLNSTLVSTAAGNTAELGWVHGSDSVSDLDDANTKLRNDPDYFSRIDEAGAYFMPGSIHRTIAIQLP